MSINIQLKLTVFIGKLIYLGLRLLGKQGTALPGKIALKLYPNILKEMGKKCEKILIITGTNGKTTTNNLINHILKGKYDNVVSNLKGANMIQGVVTSFIVNNKNSYDWGVFEVDEGSIPRVTQFIDNPDYILITNFFKDQLDRFGEVENTIQIVHDGIKNLDSTLILNGDDPSSLKFNDLTNKKIYYGLSENKFSKSNNTEEAIFCINCGNKLNYDFISYGNVGKYYCDKCGLKRPNLDYLAESIDIKDNSYEFSVKTKGNENETIYFKYLGIYNIYNSIAAIAFANDNGLGLPFIKERIESFDYKLGRMETIKFPDKDVILVLTKNPVGLSEVLNTFSYDDSKKSMMFLLNDTPADGEDVSWIWDADFEKLNQIKNIANVYCSGVRAEDAALRVKYTGMDTAKIKIFSSSNENDIKAPIDDILNQNIEKIFLIGTFTATPIARDILINKLSK